MKSPNQFNVIIFVANAAAMIAITIFACTCIKRYRPDIWSKLCLEKEYEPNKSEIIATGSESIAVGAHHKATGSIPCPPATLLNKEKTNEDH